MPRQCHVNTHRYLIICAHINILYSVWLYRELLLLCSVSNDYYDMIGACLTESRTLNDLLLGYKKIEPGRRAGKQAGRPLGFGFFTQSVENRYLNDADISEFSDRPEQLFLSVQWVPNYNVYLYV